MLEPLALRVREYSVSMPGLPREFDGFVIAQLSDLHVSAITPISIIRRAVDICNARRPDAVVLTGDFVSRRNSYVPFTLARMWARPVMEYAQRATDELQRLRAPDGIYAVPGNHDHSNGNCGAIAELLQTAGVLTLLNQSTALRGVLPLAGLDDLRAGRPRVRQALSDIAADEPQIILSHNPRLFSLLANRNCLVLTGHTHGGQVHLPLTNFRRRPFDMHFAPWFSGWYRQGAAQMYVSSGVGSVHFPMRFRCPPELAIFTLRAI